MMRILIALVLALVTTSVCFAGYALVDDLEHCKWRDGRKIPKNQCDELYDKIADVFDLAAQLREELAKPDLQDWQRKLAEKRGGELVQYSRDLMERSFKISHSKLDIGEELRDVAGRPMWSLPRDPDSRTPQELEEEREQAALKRKCGKDYMALRIGMSIKRLEECYGAVYVTKTVGKDGVIETYRTMFDMVDVKNGKVVSYTKRRY